MESDPERILRSAYLSLQTAFAHPDIHCDANDRIESLEQALESDDEGHPSPSANENSPLLARYISNTLALAELRAVMQRIAQDEGERIYASQVNASMTRAAVEALSDVFLLRIDSAKAGLKQSSYHFVESVLMRIAEKGALNEVFDRTIGRWTQSSIFMEVLTKRVLASSRFVRPVAEFIRKNMRDNEEERKAEIQISDIPNPVPESLSVSSRSSRSSSEDDKRK